MRIVFVEIRNFRGIKKLDWSPSPGINCLAGPGDATKTTILDAIEYALTPRSYIFADDSDFFNLDYKTPIKITITLADLPPEFCADNRYGLQLRGWNTSTQNLSDEPATGSEEALSLRLTIDQSLEARWSIYNERVGDDALDPPRIGYTDARQSAPTRLGPYADRHLAWGRQSVLTRIGERTENISLQLAEASRAARAAFRETGGDAFQKTVSHAELLSKLFSVPVREKFVAELDVQGVNIATGGVALHDGDLPLRRLGTGSSRLLVSALQHHAGSSQIALIDEIEHALEPHRIARLLKHLKGRADDQTKVQQIFMTTHSPVVIRELGASEIFRVLSAAGTTTVLSVADAASDLDMAQRHLRRTPEAFLARRIIVGEGRTEQGFLRGMDTAWVERGNESFALCGAIAIDGEGIPNAPKFAEHLLDLGYAVFLLLDADEPAPRDIIARVQNKGGKVVEWPNQCSTEERILLDVTWDAVISLVRYAEEIVGSDSAKDSINSVCVKRSLNPLGDLSLPKRHDNAEYRRAIGIAAKKKEWFKSIERGERLASIVSGCLPKISTTPLAQATEQIREWVNGF
jgi:putative ATP-dependent endonuclease of the OLD family